MSNSGDTLNSMGATYESARLAEEILRAMETGSKARLREGLERAAGRTYELENLSAYESEQREVLSAIAEQMRAQGGPSDVHVYLLRHFAGTVRVCLS